MERKRNRETGMATLFILHTVRAGKGIFQIGVGSLAKLTSTGLLIDFSNTWQEEVL